MKSLHWGLAALLLVMAVAPGALVVAQDDIELVPYSSDTFGIQGVVPSGWTEAAPGVYVRDMAGLVSLIQQAVPGMSIAQLSDLLVTQLGIDALPEPTGTQTTAAFTWTVYRVEVSAAGFDLVIDLALTEAAGTAYVVLLQAPAADYDALHPALFPPVIDALAPLGEAAATDSDFYVDPAGLFRVPLPTNWTSAAADGYVTLASPDDLLLVKILVVEATDDDVYAAESAAWEIVDPDFSTDEAPEDVEIPSSELDAFALRTYDLDERVISIEIRVLDGAAYVLIFDMNIDEAQKRQAQLQIIDTGFEITAIEQLDLSGVEPLPVDDVLIAALEAYVDEAMAAFDTPGVTVAIVQGGEIVYANGFGPRGPDDDTPLTPETQMMIGSTTKTLTTLLMALLVDEGVLTWDTPVVDILPSFRVSDPAITESLLVKHLVCACTGVPRRDYEWLMQADELTAEDIIESLATFEFFTDFGEAFQYSNQMVATGGYIAALAAGGEYGDLDAAYQALLQARVLDPIGMPSTTFSFEEVAAAGNYAVPYGLTLRRELVPISLDTERVLQPVAPAGALWSNALDMGQYMITLMNDGVTAAGTRLVSTENLHYLWQPQVAISAVDEYALGWIVSDYHGVPLYSHAGNTFGYTSEFMFLPDAGLGIVVQTNQRVSSLNSAVAARFLELVFDQEPTAHDQFVYSYDMMTEQNLEFQADLLDTVIQADAEGLVGTWTNAALGPVTVTLEAGRLLLDSGEFVTELYQIDPLSESMADEDNPIFLMYDSPLAGLPVIFDATDDTLTLGSGVTEYLFTRVE